jgi:O-antigen ligase
MRGHGRALLTVVVVAAIAVGAASLLHFGSRLNNRLSQSQSTSSRVSVYRTTFDETKNSPLLGHGAPSASTISVNGPQLGTQGELWLALYSFGFPGAALFIGSLAGFAWRTRRADTPPEMWLHAVPVIALATIVVYRMEATELALVMAATALCLRDRRPPPKKGAHAPATGNRVRTRTLARA